METTTTRGKARREASRPGVGARGQRPIAAAVRPACEALGPGDGFHVLVDRLWPRGVTKDKLKIDEWMKEIAPSEKLRKQYGHEIENWPKFRKRYRSEIANG